MKTRLIVSFIVLMESLTIWGSDIKAKTVLQKPAGPQPNHQCPISSKANASDSYPLMKWKSALTVPCNTSVATTVTRRIKAVMPESASANGNYSISNFTNIEKGSEEH